MSTEAVWGNLVAQLGIGAVLAFFMWHLISKSVPDLIAGFREELAVERKERHEQSIRFAQCLDRLTAHIDNLSERIHSGNYGRTPRTMLRKDESPTERKP